MTRAPYSLVLVSNLGEIAVRVCAARPMGRYGSRLFERRRGSPHSRCRSAGRARLAPPSESYLSIPRARARAAAAPLGAPATLLAEPGFARAFRDAGSSSSGRRGRDRAACYGRGEAADAAASVPAFGLDGEPTLRPSPNAAASVPDHDKAVPRGLRGWPGPERGIHEALRSARSEARRRSAFRLISARPHARATSGPVLADRHGGAPPRRADVG